MHPEYAVQLYFLDAGGNLTAQRRVLTCDDRSQLPELAMDALLAGPDEPGLTCAVPAGTQLADVSVDGALCTVVLSEEFAACDTDEASAQGCNTVPSTHRLPRIPHGWSDHTYKKRSEVPFGAFFFDS